MNCKVSLLRSLFLLSMAALPLSLTMCKSIGSSERTGECIYYNATLKNPKGSAYGSITEGAIAVKGNSILAVGDKEEILRKWKSSSTQLVDLKGGYLFPGMMDSLGNLVQLGTSLTQVDLLETRSWDDVVNRVKSRANRTPKGQWILGMGWDQNLWKSKTMPVHDALSKAVPNHPVWLLRVDVLCGIANQLALDLCGVNKEVPDKKGGKILRKKNGEPTGVLVRTAIDLVAGSIHGPTRSELKSSMLMAQSECFRAGLTGLFVPGLELEEIELLKELVDEGTWKMPVSLSLRSDCDPSTLEDLEPLVNYRGILDFRCVSVYMDGALGSRGAALLEDYSDDPLNRGILSYSEEELGELVRVAHQKGFQVSAHCIGDHAAQVTLNAYESAFKGKPSPQLRWRIEHSQIVTSADRKRYAQLGVIPSMQPTHCPSDMSWAMGRIGSWRSARAYNWRAFADLGLKIAGGSDFPVESNDPLKGVYAAVTTKSAEGLPKDGYLPGVRLTRKEALDLFTCNAAYAVFQEETRGSLNAGQSAHFTVYDQDISAGPETNLQSARVLFTVVGGQVVFKTVK